ncbi:MAG: hypothetical protein ACTHLJ_02680 [Angustibacter sp.]
MSEQPNDSTSSESSTDDLEQKAKERMEQMPAETALGNRDPQGGGEGDPKDFEPEGN